MTSPDAFEAERPRLTAIATRVLSDGAEAEDVVQQAWLRLDATSADVRDLPAWLTTVTTRLCLDRLKARVPVPTDDDPDDLTTPDPADEVALADAVGEALHVVLDRLSPPERVAFVLHDSFAVEFTTIAAVLDATPAAARKLASRARAKVAGPVAGGRLAAWEVVDAFMAAARHGDFYRLVQLLAEDAVVSADVAAVAAGTPQRIEGGREVAEFFDGSASAALPVLVGERPAAAWFHRGTPMVLFDFAIVDETVQAITFRADPDVLAAIARRDGADRRD